VNLAKSKYSPGPAPKSATIKFEASQGYIKLTSDGVNAGKDVPFKGNSDADTASPRRIDASARQSFSRR